MRVVNTFFVMSNNIIFGGLRKVYLLEDGQFVMEIQQGTMTYYDLLSKDKFNEMTKNMQN